MDTRLCVEIRVPLLGGGNEFSSGYVVSTNRVLCCRHGLFPDNRDPDRDIQLAWRKKNRSVGGTDTVSRDKICWISEQADLAVLDWSYGEKLEAVPLKQADILEAHPSSRVQEWKAFGFLGSKETDDTEGLPRFFEPYGSLPEGFGAEPDQYLQSPHEHPEQGEHWGGFSGAPVIDQASRKLIGVMTHRDKVMGEKGLRYTLLAAYLQSRADDSEQILADALKLKAPEDLDFVQDWFVDHFAARVQARHTLASALRQAYKPKLPGLGNDCSMQELAQQLLTCLTPNQRIEGLKQACFPLLRACSHGDAGNTSCDPPDVAAMGQLARLMLVMMFEDYGSLRQIHLQLNQQDGVLESITTDLLGTEALLALMDQAPPSVEVVNGKLRCSFDLTSDPDRQGLDPQQHQAIEDLANDLRASYQSGEAAYEEDESFQSFQGMETEMVAAAEMVDPGALQDVGFKDQLSREARIRIIVQILKDIGEMSQRRHYIRQPDPYQAEKKTRLWQELRRLTGGRLLIVNHKAGVNDKVAVLVITLRRIIVDAARVLEQTGRNA